MVIVFDLGFSQRGAARDAPIDRFLAAINETLLHDVGEQAQLVRFVFLGQREVGMIPVAEHAQPLELRALDVDVFVRVGLARLADRDGVRRGIAGFAHVLGYFELDGQAVAIPARHIRRMEAAQGLVLDDDVFEDLIQRGADVDIAVGEGRAIVQHESFRADSPGLDAGIKPGGFPLVQPRRLPRDQVGLHRKVGLRQI